MKLYDRDLELLRDVARPHRERRLPSPQMSLTYDRYYALLSNLHLIRWVLVHEWHQSLADDHYVVTPAGEDVLRRSKTEYPPIEVSDD